MIIISEEQLLQLCKKALKNRVENVTDKTFRPVFMSMLQVNEKANGALSEPWSELELLRWVKSKDVSAHVLPKSVPKGPSKVVEI